MQEFQAPWASWISSGGASCLECLNGKHDQSINLLSPRKRGGVVRRTFFKVLRSSRDNAGDFLVWKGQGYRNNISANPKFTFSLPFFRRKYLRHIYLLTDGATPVEEASQLGDIVNMYTDSTMECRYKVLPPSEEVMCLC